MNRLAVERVRIEDASVVWFLFALVRTAVVENSLTVVALFADDDRVSAEVSASSGGRHVLVKLHTGEAVVVIETRRARRDTRYTNLIDFVGILIG